MDLAGRLFLHAAFYYNRVRLALLRAGLGPRLELGDGADVWASTLKFVGQGRAVLSEKCVVERGSFPFILDLEAGSELFLDKGVWVRGKYRPNIVTCFEGARVKVGSGTLMNGTIVSARERVEIGGSVMMSWDTAIIDSDLHALDNETGLKPKPVEIGDYVLLASGVTVLKGAKIGSHSVIGAHSLVTGDIPDHVVAAGVPARPIREIGDRDLVEPSPVF